MQKNSIIIGGTSGIGLETARYLKANGYDVIICGRSQPADVEGITYKFIDVTKEESVAEFFSSLHVDHIDSIVFSSGITIPKKGIQAFDVDEYRKVHDVNLLGAILTLKYAFPLLKKAKGKVAIVSSFASRTYSNFSGFEYTITKSALSGMVRQLAVEWAKDGVLINTVFPSMVDTPMLRENVDQSVLTPIEKAIPLGRIAKPIEIVTAIEFLIGSKNTYITGSGLDVNGGQYLTG